MGSRALKSTYAYIHVYMIFVSPILVLLLSIHRSEIKYVVCKYMH